MQKGRQAYRLFTSLENTNKGILDQTEFKVLSIPVKKKMKQKLVRVVLVVAGTFFMGLGIVGIFVPLLPTTPFLLLAAACYARSSQRFYDWLLNNKHFGNYIRNYRERKAIPLKGKILTLALLWATIGCSVMFAVEILFVRVLLIVIAIGVSIHIFSLRTLHG